MEAPFSMNRTRIRQRRSQTSRASALVTTLMVVAVLSIIVVAFLQSMSIERRVAQSYANIQRAKLAADAGAEMAKSQIASFLKRDSVGGVAYTAWSYFTATNSPVAYTALTAGRPTNLAATNYLNPTNTIWLFSPRATDVANQNWNPDTIATLAESERTSLNEYFDRPPIDTNLSIPWYELSRTTNGGIIQIQRFAFWSEDECSRLHLSADISDFTPTNPRRQWGKSAAEVIPSEIVNDADLEQLSAASPVILTERTLAQILSSEALEKIDQLAHLTTTHSVAHNRIRYAPSHPAGVGNFKRGMRKLNLNWSAHTNAAIPAQTRVNRIADTLENGVPEFYSADQIKYYQNSTPVGAPPDHTAPASIRREMRESLAASIIDYMDADHIPTQPETLPDLRDTNILPPPVRLIADIPRPRFFGAEAAPVLNEIVTVWNAAAGETAARNAVSRSGNAAIGFTYRIPITWKFELWNMSDQAIPEREYAIRGMHVRQIVASAFGFGGEAMPPETEVVFPLGTFAFAPGEIKVVEYSETFESTGPNDLGTTWNQFRLGPDGAGGLSPGTPATNADDQPERHARSSFVLIAPESGQWISTTNYLDSTNVTADGVAALAPGNMGASKGNRINDPRSQPQRAFALNTDLTGEVSVNSADSDRDWQEQAPGSLGSINNNVNSRFYQHLGFWFDRPRLAAGNLGALALNNVVISSIRNGPLASIGELGNIYDASWYNPINRGSDSNTANNVPYRSTVRPPFRGGASLRIGQPDGKNIYGQNSWAITDVLTADWIVQAGVPEPLDEEFGIPLQTGLVNVNMPKYGDVNSGGGVSSNLAAVFRLAELEGVASGAGTSFIPDQIAASIRQRLSRGAPGITGWQTARPFFLPAEISELDVWRTPSTYVPQETLVAHPLTNTNAPRRLNRSDFAREEIVQRSLSRLTTGGRAFRTFVVGQYLTAPINDPNKLTLRATSKIEEITDFECLFDETTGQLSDVVPVTLQHLHE